MYRETKGVSGNSTCSEPTNGTVDDSTFNSANVFLRRGDDRGDLVPQNQFFEIFSSGDLVVWILLCIFYNINSIKYVNKEKPKDNHTGI